MMAGRGSLIFAMELDYSPLPPDIEPGVILGLPLIAIGASISIFTRSIFGTT